MKIYLAGGVDIDEFKYIKSVGGQNVLISFFSIKRKPDVPAFFEQLHKLKLNVFLDSGAYSAFTRNTVIDVVEYIEFVREFGKYCGLYAGLDVIGNAEKTALNIQKMQNEGLTPMPTFHRGSDFRILKRMLIEHSYIALGGMAGAKGKSMIPWLDNCFSIIRTKADVHGFAMTSCDMLYRYPFTSVDSTSWIMCGAFGQYVEFDGRVIRKRPVHTGKHMTARMINFVDGDVSGLDNKKRRTDRVQQAVIEWLKFEKHISRVWQARQISN